MNKVVLMGRFTKDPELRFTATNNIPVCSFTLAVDRRFTKGEQQADFINCQAWQKTAEFISNYFYKGKQIAVVGRIQTRTWDDNDGKRRYATEVVVEEAYFTGSKNDESSNQQEDNFYTVVDDDELPF